MRAKDFVVNRCIRVSIVVFRVSIVVFRVSFVTFYRVSFVTTPCFNRSQAVVKGLKPFKLRCYSKTKQYQICPYNDSYITKDTFKAFGAS